MPELFLSHLYSPKHLDTLLLPHADWHPYPPVSDREAWETLPEDQRQDILAQGQAALATPWPGLPATLYLRFARDGDRTDFESAYFLRRRLLAHLVLAECVQGRGRFLDAITDAAWSICEESSWCLPAHISVQQAGPGLPDPVEPIVDLFAAETSALLAWSHYLIAGQLNQTSPLVLPRIEGEIQVRILTPALERNDFWWMGFTEREVNNWNPWINSNWLASVLLIETDEQRRTGAVAKILRSLDRFIVPYPEDGGCDEGPSYWTRAGASLFDCLELLRSASSGKINVYDEPKIQNIGRFVYRAHIADGYYVNFADAPAIVSPDASLVSGFGRCIKDDAMLAMGAWLGSRATVKDRSQDLTRVLAGLFQGIGLKGNELSAPPSGPAFLAPPLLRDVYLPDIQFFAARDRARSTAGLYLAAKGGHNGESHNHNDVGHFIVYFDAKPLIIDVGVETYTRKTFSPQRYEIWTMQSAYHSLPTMGGIMQAPGREFAAQEVVYRADDVSAAFSLDLSGAYPTQVQLRSWKRGLELERGRQVKLTDAYEFTRAPATLTLSLMTPCMIELPHPGNIRLHEATLAHGRVSAAGEITYNPEYFTVASEEIRITDSRLGNTWGQQVKRLLFSAINPGRKGQWTIFIHGVK